MTTAQPSVASDLERITRAAARELRAMTEERASIRPAPGKWTPREIVGHLVDSASNNHQRFVRAQFQDDLVFPGYDQDAWVTAQRYQDAPWSELVDLFSAFNLHLARVIQATPLDVRARPRTRHNLHRLAFRPVPETEATTLDYFMRDYVEHLVHHLRQIFGPGWSPDG